MKRFNSHLIAIILIIVTINISSCSIFTRISSVKQTDTYTNTSTPTTNIPRTIMFTSTSAFTRTILSTRTYTPVATSIPASLGGGGKIVYSLSVGSGSFSDIYLYDFKLGKEMPLIIGDPTFKTDFSWSPDGKQIAFSAESPEDNFHIVVVNVESGIMQTIGYSKSCRNIYPSWSPDGKRIVYISDCDGSGGGLHIYIMNSDGTNPIRLTDFDSATPNWSPDGKKIAFSILQGEIKGVYVMNSDGRDIRQLANFGDSPQWSPDGTKIAFMYDGPVDARIDLGIYIMNCNGNNLVNINKGGNTPSWSPDGKLIAISSGPDIIIIDKNGKIISSLPATPNVLYPMWSH